MNRIYISGKITGNDNYKDEFSKAEEYLKSKGYKVINPARLDIPDLTWEEYMNIDLMLLGNCEFLYQLPNWEDSTGAKIEYGFALGRDITIVKGEI